MSSGQRAALFAILVATLGGCGLSVPEKDPFSDDTANLKDETSSQGRYENKIVEHVVCELALGLHQADQLLLDQTSFMKQQKIPRGQKLQLWGDGATWLDSWGTTVSLTITAQEQSSVNPGVSLIRPLENSVRTFSVGGNVISAQSTSLGIGASGSANATRSEEIQFTFVNRDLMAIVKGNCADLQNGLMINSDLKIRQFIYDKLLLAASGNANDVRYQYDQSGNYCDANDNCYSKNSQPIGYCKKDNALYIYDDETNKFLTDPSSGKSLACVTTPDGAGNYCNATKTTCFDKNHNKIGICKKDNAPYIYDPKSKTFATDSSHKRLKCLAIEADNSTWPLYNTFTEEITFVASLGGNITPSWKFATSTYNATGNLLSAQRTYTNDLIVTIGPVETWPTPNQPAKLDSTASTQHSNRALSSAIASQPTAGGGQ